MTARGDDRSSSAGHDRTDVPEGTSDRLRHPLEAHADRFVAHFFDDDFDRISDELFEPDFVREDRSSLPFPPTDLAGLRAAASALGEGRTPRIRRGPLLAVRQNCYLGSSTTEYEGGQENSRLVVLVAGPSGRIARMITFDLDDVDAALAELDRWDDRSA